MNLLRRRCTATRRRWLITISMVAILLMTFGNARAQTVNLDRVIAELEPEIQRAMLEGKIPSATVALVSGDKVVWSNAYGYANLWARTPATLSTVYLIG